MALNSNMVELLTQWCLRSDEVADIRAAARGEFFGYDIPGEANYLEGTGDVTSRERRFVGWFALTYKLPDGRYPVELAAAAVFSGRELISAIDSFKNSRYVLAMISWVNPGKGLILKLDEEEFTVDNRYLSRHLKQGNSLFAHIIPVGRRGWVIGPGWTESPIRIMPGMQAMLKKFPPNPIDVERLLQQRFKSSEDQTEKEQPRDDTMRAAVARMTKEAKAAGRQGLIMTSAQWKKVVLFHMPSRNINDFSKEIVNRVGNDASVEEYNKWLGLAMNIWNNTPQPDRGGKSANKLCKEYYGERPETR